MNSAAEWYSEQEYRERCGMPHEGAAMPKQKISNGDRIRQMTDEELAYQFAEWICDELDVCPLTEVTDGIMTCEQCRIAWLKQEAKDDAEAKG